MKKILVGVVAAMACAGAFASAQAPVDLNGIWGVAPLPPAVKAGDNVRWLLPLRGVNPEGTDVFKGLDRLQVNARAAAPNKPEYKPELLAKVKELSDKQGVLDPAFYCKPQGVPRMGAPAQIVQTPGQVVFLYAASSRQTAVRIAPTLIRRTWEIQSAASKATRSSSTSPTSTMTRGLGATAISTRRRCTSWNG